MNHLKIFVDPAEKSLLALYKTAVEKHNDEVMKNPFPNAGFDLFVPSVQITLYNNTYWIDHRVKATMTESLLFPRTIPSLDLGITKYDAGTEWQRVARGYCIYPRSSLSKTPLMLANHVGVIDSGYSGYLMGAFRHISSKDETFVIEKGTRLLQICHPGLLPFTVEIVESEKDLFEGAENTQRGSGGFGSTGK